METIQPLGTTTLCLRVDNKPVGFVSILHYRETRQGELVGLYVDPEYRGRGLGKKLIRAALDAARAEGIEEVKSTVVKGNVESNGICAATGAELQNCWIWQVG